VFCKGIFGVLMTFFRLELEEYTEVKGKILNDPLEPNYIDRVQKQKGSEESKSILGIRAADVEGVVDAKMKLQWIEKLLVEALKQAGDVDRNILSAVCMPTSPSSPNKHHSAKYHQSADESRRSSSPQRKQSSRSGLKRSNSKERDEFKEGSRISSHRMSDITKDAPRSAAGYGVDRNRGDDSPMKDTKRSSDKGSTSMNRSPSSRRDKTPQRASITLLSSLEW